MTVYNNTVNSPKIIDATRVMSSPVAKAFPKVIVPPSSESRYERIPKNTKSRERIIVEYPTIYPTKKKLYKSCPLKMTKGMKKTTAIIIPASAPYLKDGLVI